MEFKVLDKGYVKLVDQMGTDEGIVEAARMSTGRGFVSWDPYERCKVCDAIWLNQPDGTVSLSPRSACGPCCDNGPTTTEKFLRGDQGILETLYANRHMTPFEMCEIQIEVKAPLMVFREWHRHRTQSYNEFSARYAVMPNEHYVPEPGRIAKQSKTNKQGSGELFSQEDAEEVCTRLEQEQEAVYANYDVLVRQGVANEIARLNTPVSRYSKMRAKADLRNWLGFLALRMDLGAQKEIRQYANAVATIIKTLYPRTFALFVEHDFMAVRFSREEMRVLRELATQVLSRDGNLFEGNDKKSKAFITKLTDDKEAKYADVDAFKP